MFVGKTKVKLQLQVGGPNIQNDADADKVRTAEPFRFRLNYGATIDPGIDTFLMSRTQIDDLQKTILVELGAQGANVSAGAERMVNNTISRVEQGGVKIIQGIQSVRRLTHPDILMLVDMKQNSDFYVPSKSAFFKQFKVLADKVLDLSFCALAFPKGTDFKGLNMAKAGDIPQSVRDFKGATKNVTRGMDQFEYDLPNIAYTSPYVNFSVIPNDANYSQPRFPKRFNRATEQMEKIPKTDFLNTYLFYVNELFNTYRRYLRLIGFSERLAPVLDVPAEAVLPDDESDDEPEGDPVEPFSSVSESLEQQKQSAIERDDVKKVFEIAKQQVDLEREELAKKQTELAAKSGASSSSDPGNESDLPAPPPGEVVEQKEAISVAEISNLINNSPAHAGHALEALRTANLDWESLRTTILNSDKPVTALESRVITVKIRNGNDGAVSEPVQIRISELLPKSVDDKTPPSKIVEKILKRFSAKHINDKALYSTYVTNAKKTD